MTANMESRVFVHPCASYGDLGLRPKTDTNRQINAHRGHSAIPASCHARAHPRPKGGNLLPRPPCPWHIHLLRSFYRRSAPCPLPVFCTNARIWGIKKQCQRGMPSRPLGRQTRSRPCSTRPLARTSQALGNHGCRDREQNQAIVAGHTVHTPQKMPCLPCDLTRPEPAVRCLPAPALGAVVGPMGICTSRRSVLASRWICGLVVCSCRSRQSAAMKKYMAWVPSHWSQSVYPLSLATWH
jgi:hypothetical protein